LGLPDHTFLLFILNCENSERHYSMEPSEQEFISRLGTEYTDI
jgi:hypothetical protein